MDQWTAHRGFRWDILVGGVIYFRPVFFVSGLWSWVRTQTGAKDRGCEVKIFL